MTSTAPDRLDRIEVLVEANSKAIADLKEEIAKLEENLGQSQRWQDRTWDAIKFIGGISTSLAIATTVALIGVLLRVTGG